ncbi:IS1634 family transposase [Dubosiella newyorkensis]|jgi:transposase|nr:IS1634 family transposase [Dubosiella newyorkensis]
MSIRLHSTSSKGSVCYYIKEDYTNPLTKKRTTRNRQSLGNLSSLMEKYSVSSREEVESILKMEIEAMRKAEKKLITLDFDSSALLPLDSVSSFNVGYLFPWKILSMLGISAICRSIAQRNNFKFDLEEIMRLLVCARIIAPGSKKGTLDTARSFYRCPLPNLHDVYRALPVLAQERYFIEKEIYKNSQKICTRDSAILFYDCTNFYFEIEEDDDFRRYGKSKENRPNPIAQYGLFTDRGGIPIADICFEGNRNESFSMRELEKTLEKDFGFSRFIVCADAALNGFENKLYNDRKENGAYIVTQPIKKMKKTDREWALDRRGWRILGSEKIYDLDQLGETVFIHGHEIPAKKVTFYKDRWIKTIKKSHDSGKKEELEEHIIVSYSTKYRNYQRRIREKKLERAEAMLKNPGKITKTTDQRNPRYYIHPIEKDGNSTPEYELDTQRIAEDMRYDGFYAVTTDLKDEDIELIIQANHQRWEIEECFRIMKSELEVRPIFVSRREAIEGHLLTCFIALVVYRILEQYLENKYTIKEIIETLKNMNAGRLKGAVYRPTLTRTELTDELAKIFEYQFAYEVIEEKDLNKIVKNANGKNVAKFIKERKGV